MLGVAIALLGVGYAVGYYGFTNLKSGGKGPSFGDVVGFPSQGVTKGLVTRNAQGSGNETGQPPTTPNPPAQYRRIL